MPPKKKATIDQGLVDTIWVAGMISSGGSLKLVEARNVRVVRFVITSSLLPESITRLCQYTGNVPTKIHQTGTKNEGLRIAIQGASLHTLMTRVWDYLSRERKQQYADLRRQITATLEGPNPYRNDKKIEDYEEEQ